MTTHDFVRELAEKASHVTTVTVGAIGSVYSLFTENPIGFICAAVAVGSFVVNWYYSHRRLQILKAQQRDPNCKG
ncbi:hypothetical protein ACL7TT_10130 [Microbulbifer sp. 2304DJ12-6]|uniref:hypothetical protein n=1 Tax=Microbulbifer sp. 2304DJ12-6 TaxID=3233340 RepID=UPI0039B06D02